MDDVALPIGEHLEFDVPRSFEELLHVDSIIAECRTRLSSCDADRVQQRRLAVHDTHAAATAATRCLDDDRIADVARHAQILIRVITQRSIGSRHARHAVRFHDANGRDLVAHGADCLRLRADEHEAALFNALREIRVLG